MEAGLAFDEPTWHCMRRRTYRWARWTACLALLLAACSAGNDVGSEELSSKADPADFDWSSMRPVPEHELWEGPILLSTGLWDVDAKTATELLSILVREKVTVWILSPKGWSDGGIRAPFTRFQDSIRREQIRFVAHDDEEKAESAPLPWVRDFGPIVVQDAEKRYALVSNRYLERPGADANRYQVSLQSRQNVADALGLQIRDSGLNIDGGMLAIRSGRPQIFASAAAALINGFSPDGRGLQGFTSALGRVLKHRVTVFFDRFPGEMTTHIDPFFVVLKEDQALIGRPDEGFTTGEYNLPDDAAVLRHFQTTLATVQSQTDLTGMWAATIFHNGRYLDQRFWHWRSYASVMVLNEQTVIAPRYLDQPLNLRRQREAELETSLRGAGFTKIHWLNADALINTAGGGLHCTYVRLPNNTPKPCGSKGGTGFGPRRR